MVIKTPQQIETTLEDIGKKKASLPFWRMFILAILAGVYIGFGAAFGTLVSHDLSTYIGLGFAKLITGIAFSVGLILVLIGGAELFTGNNLLIIPALSHEVSYKNVARNWIVVYMGNFVGSMVLVLLIFASGYWKINNYEVGAAAVKIAADKTALSFLESFVRGLLANWLVCLAVWLSVASKDTVGKILGIIFPITAFAAMGFEHCIANMYFIPLGLLLKSNTEILDILRNYDLSSFTWGSFFVDNLLPVTLGNIAGGVFFVGFLYWFAYRRRCEKLESGALVCEDDDLTLKQTVNIEESEDE